jgi:hypothetical protein
MKSGLKNFVLVVVSLGIVGVARAIPVGTSLSIFDGVNPVITIDDNLTGDLNPATGELTLSTNVGVWSLSISTGVTKPALGAPKVPIMDLVIQASSTNAGTLQYVFSDTGFTPFETLNSTVSGHVISGAPTTVNYSVYGDASNNLGALTTQLTSTGTIPLPVLTTNSGLLSLGSLFSLSEVVQINASGASAVSVDASLNVSPIPEPSSVEFTFLGLAFLVVGLAHRRRSLHGAIG